MAMNSLTIILIIALVIAIGAITYLAVTRNSMRQNYASNADAVAAQTRAYEESTRRVLEESRHQYERQIEETQRQYNSQLQENQRLHEKQIKALEERLERQALEVRERSSLEFQSLAEKALQNQSARLNENNKNEIGAILSPFKEKLSEFKTAVDDAYIKENSTRKALASQIDSLLRANNEIGQETRRLSEALKGNSALQGKWGEIVLEKILEAAGLRRDVHFVTQTTSVDGQTIKSETGSPLRADVILLLPGNHKIVVDSKTSISDYLRYAEAETPEEEASFLKKHAISVKKHIDELASKQYHKLISGALEHTLMFMPNDASFLGALRGDSTLPDYALSKNVTIVSPAHIMSVVQLMAQLWRIENQNRNAEQIALAAGKLYDKFVNFISDFEAIGRNLQATRNAYDRGMDHLTKGSVSLTRRAEKLRELGAKTSKRIPESMLDSECVNETNAGA